MKIRLLLPFTLLLLAAQDASPVAITYPAEGDVISGELTVMGTTDVLGFVSAQLDFAYASDSTGTWFSLQTISRPEIDSPLTTWDTNLITDGEYILRLQVNLDDGTIEEAIVLIKIQNDAPILTPTPVVTTTPGRLEVGLPTPFLVAASPTPTLTPHPSPTPLPANPVTLNQPAIYTSLGRGALVIIGLFLFAGLVLRFRRY